MSHGLTKRQAEALAFIADYIAHNGCSPSYREIRDGLGLRSQSGVQRLVVGLVDRGRVTIMQNHARSIALVERAP